MRTCKVRLATLWLVACGIAFLLLVLQTIFGKYDGQADAAWGWLLPSVMPTLSLIIGVLVVDSRGEGSARRNADRFMFRVAFGLSAAYLLVVLTIILAQPLTQLPALELMRQSNLYLGPLQGLVAAALGAFFIKSE